MDSEELDDSDAESCQSDDTLDDYCLEWLFDETRMDHLPIEQQLALHTQRDLRKVKIYKIATQLFGKKVSRKRVIEAPSMKDYDPEELKRSSNSQKFNSELKPQVPPPVLPSEKEIATKEHKEKVEGLEKWIAERQKFREDLDSMTKNTEKWLAYKTDRTPLEQRVLKNYIEAKQPKITKVESSDDKPRRPSQMRKTSVSKKKNDNTPMVAIEVIDDFLYENKLRLIDLFVAADRDKDWMLSRKEFRHVVKKAKIPISSKLLDELIIALDVDNNNQLDYSELAKGMDRYRAMKRTKKSSLLKSRRSTAEEQHISNFEQFRRHYDPFNDSTDHPAIVLPDISLPGGRERRSSRKRSWVKRSAVRKDADNKSDSTTEEDKAVTDHITPTTRSGETAEQVDEFRQLKLKEFNEICALCQSNNIVLDKALLERVLLHPKDKPLTKDLRKNIRQPGSTGDLLPKLAKKPRDRAQVLQTQANNKDNVRMKVTSSGRLMTETVFPARKDVEPKLHKLRLSTGKAHVRRQVDCWLSFEEYDNLTQHLAQKFPRIHGLSDDNAFWPGHLLDKIRMHMPDSYPKVSNFFNTVILEKKIYPGYENKINWAQNGAGYIQMGVVDPYAKQNIF